MPRVRRKDFPDFNKELGQLDKLIRELPTLVGNMAVNFYDDSWEREGFLDRRLNKWPKRKRRERGSRRLLVKTGELRRSLGFKLQRYTSGARITLYADTPYAQTHNEGLKYGVSVRAHTRRVRGGKRTKVKAHKRNVQMPKRQFMGKSRVMEKLIEKRIERALNKILK